MNGLTISEDNRQSKNRFMVYWLSRAMTTNREVVPMIVREISSKTLGLEFPFSQAIGSDLNVECHFEYQNKKQRLRFKTKVTYCMVLANSSAVKLDVKILQAGEGDIHTFNNVLATLSESKEVNLRI